MFKNALKKACKTLGVTVLLVGCILLLRNYYMHNGTSASFTKTKQDKDVAAILSDTLEQIKGYGLTKVQENNNLSLFVDFNDGNIEVLNRSNGFVWRSKPAAEELSKEKVNDLWRGNLESPVMIEYVDNLKKATPVIGNIKNQNAEVKVLKNKEDIRVCIDFKVSKIKIGFDLHLNNNNVEIDIPYYLVEEYGNNKLVGYSMLPFFGAVRGTEKQDGYMLVPDGSGGIINFDENKTYKNEYVGRIYGDDMSLIASQRKLSQLVYYPVYGIKNGLNSMLSVIDEGESTAEIYGVPANIKTSFNTAYARFIHRSLYRVNTDLAGGGYLKYSENGNIESRKLYYYFLKEDKSDYVGMAEAYRSYLMDVKNVQKRKTANSEIPLQLVIFGGDVKQGLLGKSFVKTTSFEEAETIIKGFFQMNIKRMEVVFEGWSKKGAGAKYPERFPAEQKLGGDKGLTNFVDVAHKLGYKVFLMDNYADALSTKGISKRREAVYSVSKIPLTQGSKKEIFNINALTIERLLEKNIPVYKRYGVDGIEEKKLATNLSTDFNPYNPFTRTQQKDQYAKCFDYIKNELGSIRVKQASAFCLGNIGTITDMPDNYGYYAVIDEGVPFYHIAIHGLVDYVTRPYNFFDEPSREVLKAIEYGANVSFVVTMENPQVLKETGSNLYSSEFYLLRSDIKYQYERIKKALSGVQDQFIIEHESIQKNVKKVVYENGREIIINYSNVPVTYRDVVIQPMNFDVFEGERKK